MYSSFLQLSSGKSAAPLHWLVSLARALSGPWKLEGAWCYISSSSELTSSQHCFLGLPTQEEHLPQPHIFPGCTERLWSQSLPPYYQAAPRGMESTLEPILGACPARKENWGSFAEASRVPLEFLGLPDSTYLFIENLLWASLCAGCPGYNKEKAKIPSLKKSKVEVTDMQRNRSKSAGL